MSECESMFEIEKKGADITIGGECYRQIPSYLTPYLHIYAYIHTHMHTRSVSVESTGALSSADIFRESLRVLEEKCDTILHELRYSCGVEFDD